MAVEYQKTCVATLESRRFDKVKVVRDAMNQTLKLWKEIGVDGPHLSPSTETQSQSSSRDTVSVGRSPFKSPAKFSQGAKSGTPMPKKSVPPSRSPPSSNSSCARNGIPSPVKKNCRKSDRVTPTKFNGHTDWKVEVVIPRNESPKVAWDEKLEQVDSEVVKHAGDDKKDSLIFNKIHNTDNVMQPNGLKGSHQFPVIQDNSDNINTQNLSSDDARGDNEIEGLSIVQQQLMQIENQQSNLLDLLHRFMGTSQNGMSALESRVQGLEMALDEISHDLAVSTRRSGSETCCKLPGTEFLSPKFWKRSEKKYFI